MKLYNTLSNTKEEFTPLNAKQVKMYVCGPTVYNEIHVGNLRSVLVFDLLYRVLKQVFEDVVYVRNITDIDDKIIAKAHTENKQAKDVAEFWEASFKETCAKLNVLSPTYQPRATDVITEIIEAIGELVEQGFAYVEEGNVLFRISALEEYGKLSKQSSVIDGKRVVSELNKEDAKDFVLWKPSKLGEPYWNSPWGKGRPGWHIECTVMSAKYLGTSFDIHGGGQDLIFPHHENEQAQNVGLYGEYAGPRYWIHNAMVLFDGEKMSKSLGNIVLVSEALQQYNPELLRFFILGTHYRHVLMWKDENIKQAEARLQRWMYHLEGLQDGGDILQEFLDALQDDLNTSQAFAVFEEKLAEAIKNHDNALFVKLANTLDWLGCMYEKTEDSELLSQLQDLLKQRTIAREAKDYIKADEIRKMIESHGYEIVDTNGMSELKRRA